VICQLRQESPVRSIAPDTDQSPGSEELRSLVDYPLYRPTRRVVTMIDALPLIVPPADEADMESRGNAVY
jgi:hypothetical protein